MKPTLPCAAFAAVLPDLASGLAPDIERVQRGAEHAAACPPCAALLARERRLVGLLVSAGRIPDVPRDLLSVPPVPVVRAAPVRRLMPWLAAVSAAAAVFVAAWGAGLVGRRGPAEWNLVLGAVVDGPATTGTASDEVALGLLAGPEAVAGRWPALWPDSLTALAPDEARRRGGGAGR